jgi:hypothetical protein
MTKEPEKMAKVFIALISVTALAVAVAGGIFVYHQQLVEEKSGLWEPLTPIITDTTKPVIFNPPFPHHISWAYPFSSIPP